MGMSATFYNNASNENVVNKQLTLIKTLSESLDITNDFSIDAPNFLMNRDDDLLSANYMYVPQFSRYYFIKVEVVDGVFMRITATSDPLTSFWNSIKTSQCIAYRSTSKPDNRIEDDKVFKKEKPTIIYRKIGQPFSLSENNNYILTVTGRGV